MSSSLFLPSENKISPSDMDLVSTAFFASLGSTRTDDTRDANSLDAAVEALQQFIICGRQQQDVLKEKRAAVERALMDSPVTTFVEARLSSCAEWRRGMEAIKRDPSAWMLMQCTSHTPHQVLPGLWLGGYYTASNQKELEQLGITHICSCIDTAPKFPERYQYATFPMEDVPHFDPTPLFRGTTAFIVDALTSGGVVLVHCGAGISRAPTVVAALLVTVFGLSGTQAIDLIHRVRPCINPNSGFVKKLREFSVNRTASCKPALG